MKSVVGLIYGEMNEDVKAQITRDLIILNADWDFDLVDPAGKLDIGLLDMLNIKTTVELPTIYLVYKTGEKWPDSPLGVQRVERDMCPSNANTGLDPSERVGYYLKPQGRDGANLTERYLHRSYPRGRGIVDPFVLMLWG